MENPESLYVQVKAKTVEEELCDYPRPESGGRSPLKSFLRRASLAPKTPPPDSRVEVSACCLFEQVRRDIFSEGSLPLRIFFIT